MAGANYISFPRVEGAASKQAHADLPEGTFERELGKEGFFGPATMMYHSHPPTGWTSWTGRCARAPSISASWRSRRAPCGTRASCCTMRM